MRCVGRLWKHPDGRLQVWHDDGSTTYHYRLIAAIKLGRSLSRREVVHHLNGDPSDDSFGNLEVLDSQREHINLHRHDLQAWFPRNCTECGIEVAADKRTTGCQTCKSRHLRWKWAGKPYCTPLKEKPKPISRGCRGCGGHVDDLNSSCPTCVHRHCERQRTAA